MTTPAARSPSAPEPAVEAERALDLALEQTFPASDPPAMLEPAPSRAPADTRAVRPTKERQ